MRYFLKLAYRGEAFHGWQSQPNAVSVQQVVEHALQTVLRVPVQIVGAGRTDAGVNARTMYAHFNSDRSPNFFKGTLTSLNHLVGRDIVIYDIIPVPDNAHARFDATSRTYKYFVTYLKDPFRGKLAWYCHRRLDVALMNKAAAELLQVTDFTSFAKLHSDAKTNICDVTLAHWEQDGEDGLVFTITADRFLRNMVRAVVGTLVDVGKGIMSLSDFERVIDAKDRCSAGTSMPGEALFLWDVTYPYL